MWFRYAIQFWRGVWKIIHEIIFEPWSWIEIFLLIILVLILIHGINKHGGFFKVHRAESVWLPIKVHFTATREPTELEKILRLTETVKLPENPHGILKTKKKSPRFGA